MNSPVIGAKSRPIVQLARFAGINSTISRSVAVAGNAMSANNRSPMGSVFAMASGSMERQRTDRGTLATAVSSGEAPIADLGFGARANPSDSHATSRGPGGPRF
jgi:hypothetical protein